ncbi:unnamed protein product [Knipowitschia caucasica]|uniref:Uncharacterized protein n=1 Tax=Knipowitschia caucasica TaxID=637954 RepID=A0AAV2MR85_KNICA
MRHSAAAEGEGGRGGEVIRRCTSSKRDQDISLWDIYLPEDAANMTASHTHLSHHLLVLLLICRHVNTNLLVLENTTAITEPPVETPGPKSSPLAPHTPMQTGQNRQSVVLTDPAGPKTSPLAPLTELL